MDDTDRKLLILLAANPRMHFRELAKRLGITKQAAYHRMEILTEDGVIKGTTASVSAPYLGAIPVAIFGTSEAASAEEAMNKLGESEFTRRVAVCGGNYVYVVGYLRNTSELGGYVEFVKEAAEMPDPTVAIYDLDEELMPYSVDGSGKRKQSYRELTSIDLGIIASLKDNVRRPIVDIAGMVGATPKTVRRHIEDMISDGSLYIGMDVDLASGGDMLVTMHVNLRNDANKKEVGRRLQSKHYFLDQYIRFYGNLPSFLGWIFWSNDMAKIRKALKETREDKDVMSVMLNIVHSERRYSTWIDKLSEAGARPSEKAKRRSYIPR